MTANLENNQTPTMTENELRIEHIKVKQLPEFAGRVIRAAQPGQFIPISMQRAVAHAQNPYADPDDVGLLVAIDEDEEVVGYFGIMPMQLRVGDTYYQTHWFTTWSVSSKVRGRGVGSLLMKEALTLNKDFLIVGSVHARRVCRKYGFWERDPLKYYWLDPSGMGSLNPLTTLLRLARKTAHMLKIKQEIPITTTVTRGLDRVFSPLFKRIFYPLLTARLAPLFQKFEYREVPKIREHLLELKNRPEVELHRGPQAVNWMLNYPWIVEKGQSQTEQLDYYFSDARPLYRLVALEITDPQEGSYLGFVVFSISQKAGGIALKTLDFRFGDPVHYPFILALAVRYGRRYRADTLEIPKEVAAGLEESILGKLLLQEKKRIYQCYPQSENSPLAGAWQDICLHLYDGDMAFS